MDYLESGVKSNIDGFKDIVKDFEKRLNELERQAVLDKAEVSSELSSLKTMFESVYKKSVQDAIEKVANEKLSNLKDGSNIDNLLE